MSDVTSMIKKAGYVLSDRYDPFRWIHPNCSKLTVEIKFHHNPFLQLIYSTIPDKEWWFLKYQKNITTGESFWDRDGWKEPIYHGIEPPTNLNSEQFLVILKLMTEMDRIFEHVS
jgi:hypothetical protein